MNAYEFFVFMTTIAVLVIYLFIKSGDSKPPEQTGDKLIEDMRVTSLTAKKLLFPFSRIPNVGLLGIDVDSNGNCEITQVLDILAQHIYMLRERVRLLESDGKEGSK